MRFEGTADSRSENSLVFVSSFSFKIKVVPVSSGSQNIKTIFDGPVDANAFKASIVFALRNLSSTYGSDAGTSLVSTNIKILGITTGFCFLFFVCLSSRLPICFSWKGKSTRDNHL